MNKRRREGVDFTDEDALKFRISMFDPVARAKLYEETAPRKKINAPETNKNEHGFTDEEVTFIKEAFPEEGGKRRKRKSRKVRKSRKTRKVRRSRTRRHRR